MERRSSFIQGQECVFSQSVILTHGELVAIQPFPDSLESIIIGLTIVEDQDSIIDGTVLDHNLHLNYKRGWYGGLPTASGIMVRSDADENQYILRLAASLVGERDIFASILTITVVKIG